jgi:hypothetical protein
MSAQVHDPGELRRVAHDDLVSRPAGWKPELDGLDPFGPRARGTLLKEEFALGAVDVALQRHRTASDPTDRAIGDRQVVVNEVELRMAGVREEDLPRVRDRDLTPCDLDDLLGFRHGPHDRTRTRRVLAGQGPIPRTPFTRPAFVPIWHG